MKFFSSQCKRLFQIFILNASYYFLFIFFKLFPRKRCSWVVGIQETAGMLSYVAESLPESISVNLFPHKFYDYTYTYEYKNSNFLLHRMRVNFFYPILLAYLANISNGFFYFGKYGFLRSDLDGRGYEFRFLKKRNIKLICYFLGTDIRSMKKMNEIGKKYNRDVISDYLPILHPSCLSTHYELEKKMLSHVVETYADIIINAPVDQASYITRPCYPFLYFYPDNKFKPNFDKFLDVECVRIAHAPSSPIIKGTQIVRAAIKKLQSEKYNIEYIELIGMKNDIVLEALSTAHIVLNEFYTFVPGLFGVEAMANSCVLLTSADPEIETSLEADAKDAWVITPYWEIYHNLKSILDNPESMMEQAKKGYEWALANCSNSNSRNKLLNIISKEFE